MARGIGGGYADLASYGVGVGSQALESAGRAAELEQQRESLNRQIVGSNVAANIQLGSAVGGVAGYALGAKVGLIGGPWGAVIGSVIGGLAGGLF